MGAILSVPVGLGILVGVAIVPQALRLAGPIVCPPGTRRTSVLTTTRMDYTHAPKEMTEHSLACHDAQGTVMPTDGWMDLEVLAVMTGYSWAAAAVGLTVYRLIRGKWWDATAQRPKAASSPADKSLSQ